MISINWLSIPHWRSLSCGLSAPLPRELQSTARIEHESDFMVAREKGQLISTAQKSASCSIISAQRFSHRTGRPQPQSRIQDQMSITSALLVCSRREQVTASSGDISRPRFPLIYLWVERPNQTLCWGFASKLLSESAQLMGKWHVCFGAVCH